MRTAVTLLAVCALANCAPRATGEGIDRERMFTVWSRKDVSHFSGVLPTAVDSVWRIVPIAFQSLHFPGAPSVYPVVERQEPVRCTGTGKLEAIVFHILQDSARVHP